MRRLPFEYCERTYRSNSHLNNYFKYNLHVPVKETDVFVRWDTDQADFAYRQVFKYRAAIECYIAAHPNFLSSLKPLPDDELAPSIVQTMLTAGQKADVGPMAAVAGAIAEFVGQELLLFSRNVIVENGGDLFIAAQRDVSVGIFAGESPLSDQICLRIRKEEMPLGICTSSATVGHSLSFGKADALCIKSQSPALADAVATAIGNLVKSKEDIRPALDAAMEIERVSGAVIILGKYLGAIGDMELVEPGVSFR